MSKVSVVVPIFNAGNKLSKCIKSILNQTFTDFELILVNDGSTDNSLQVCKEYEKRDRRIIIIDKNNEGSIATRKRGLDFSKSDYVMFVDADDWINKKMIEVLYLETIKSDTDITICNMYRALGTGFPFIKKNKSEYFSEDKIYNQEEIKKDLVVAYFHGHPFPPSLCAKLYKKELLISSGKYLDRISFLGDDLYYNLEVFIKANRVKILKKPLYYYRFGGFTGKYMPNIFDDMVNGYHIQKEVINEYFLDSKQIRYNGISVMFLNTFKTCLYNLFYSELNETEIKESIRRYISNDVLKECLTNQGCIRYFSKDFLSALKNKDINYLYNMGYQMFKRRKTRRYLMDIFSKFQLRFFRD
jgi:glycosyltransferase involved in cell wall biosynthesis